MAKERSIVDQTLRGTLLWGGITFAVVWGVWRFFGDGPSESDVTIGLVILAFIWVRSSLSALEAKQEEQYQELTERIDSLPEDILFRISAERNRPLEF